MPLIYSMPDLFPKFTSSSPFPSTHPTLGPPLGCSRAQLCADTPQGPAGMCLSSITTGSTGGQSWGCLPGRSPLLPHCKEQLPIKAAAFEIQMVRNSCWGKRRNSVSAQPPAKAGLWNAAGSSRVGGMCQRIAGWKAKVQRGNLHCSPARGSAAAPLGCRENSPIFAQL